MPFFQILYLLSFLCESGISNGKTESTDKHDFKYEPLARARPFSCKFPLPLQEHRGTRYSSFGHPGPGTICEGGLTNSYKTIIKGDGIFIGLE